MGILTMALNGVLREVLEGAKCEDKINFKGCFLSRFGRRFEQAAC